MSRHTRIHLLAVAPAAASAVFVAACGGSSPPTNTASAGGPRSGQPGYPAYQFSECMRSHGVSNFPDPVFHREGSHLAVMLKIDPSISRSPAFKSASQACGHLINGPGAQLSGAALQRQTQNALAFARCMRARGFPSFPDPTAHGQLTPQMVTAAGINIHQPAVLHAGLACISVTHGMLTRADIERAVNGGGGG